ncbi:Biotin carboxyl carrier protein of acetyl-CoA carboxylase [Quillaja saponaria]|uniref:Biotin carboxyl carrier protein of acetyl-CoA carboxylase n=1 Tax=Quillaja saponaria TaxID=32244 RepID=A0AAD7Q460_QUISA|nr:Biotin carboxyl carrier protein of acetyl-CoA carboxylase [Quillaja saponaria]
MASFAVPCPKSSSLARLGLAPENLQRLQPKLKLSFQSGLSLKPSLSFGSSFGDQASSGIQCLPLWKLQAQFNEAATAEKSSNSAPVLSNGSVVDSPKEKDDTPGKLSGQSTIPDASSISAFMTQVSDLVKLVDSRDITELQLKQFDCELVIRKKEALQQPPATSVATMPPPPPHFMYSSPPPPAPVSTPAPASPKPQLPALPSPAKTSTSSHPPLKCPMAGTLYRSAAPGEPPFVKVGDKVKKGQVICIIEAMKLMNEIEADQSGTVVEILVEDGKPVSIDMPLFVIAP